MNSLKKDKIVAKIALLKKSYLENLPIKLREVEEAWETLSKKDESNQIKILHTLLHGLAGSGASFGCAGISRIARQLAKLFRSMMEGDHTLSDEHRQHIEKLIYDLKSEAAAPDKPQLLNFYGRSSGQQDEDLLVYILEDNLLLGEKLALHLEQTGYRTVRFSDIASFVEQTKAIPPAAIVADIVFPEGDAAGIAAVREIQRLREANIPVVYLSARDDIEARLQAVRSGTSHYIVKPSGQPLDLNKVTSILNDMTGRFQKEPYRVMIVDDDIPLSRLYALTLEQAGISTMVVNAPLLALEEIATFKPELLLLDLYMPGCSGNEIAAIIRQDEHLATLSIVFLSSETDFDFQMEAMGLGGDDFISKPVDDKRLIKMVLPRLRRSRILNSMTVELRESGQLYQNVVENISAGIVVLDKKYKVLSANPSLLGWFPDITSQDSCHDIFQNVSDIMECPGYSSTGCVVHSCFMDGKSHENEISLEVDGSRKDFLTVASPIFDENNKAGEVVLLFEDISERKRAEKELAKAKIAAENANRSKSEFLANMSHEIRTPMNAILGFSELALDREQNPKNRDYFNKIYFSAKSLLGVINDILDFSKIEAGRLNLEIREFYLPEILEGLIGLFGGKANEKGLELLVVATPEVPSFMIGDVMRINQVLVNLVSNAMKFTEEGEIKICVSHVLQNEKQIRLKFAVRDSGMGIDREKQELLFKAFSQADTTTTRKYGGTGLGLTICKQLVEIMGGHIEVDSEVGRGTVFSFEIDLGLGIRAKESGYLIPDELHGMNILVVDDHKVLLKMVSNMLNSFGFNSSVADSGRDALTMLDREFDKKPFDLVIIDWQMPAMDGVETCRRIRADKRFISLPIIMMSSYDPEIMVKAALDVTDNFLGKPFTTSHLFNAIMNVCGCQVPDPSYRARKNILFGKETVAGIAGARVLLVEDNTINREVAGEILATGKLHVEYAVHGQEALEKFANGKYDIILMDIQMPLMDGYETTRKIREQELAAGQDAKAPIPIIAMTAHALEGYREKCLRAGMDDYVTKPIDRELLFSTLINWLPKREYPSSPVLAEQEEITSRAVPQTERIKLPENLPGLDLATGIRRLEGNRKLYMKLLKQFNKDSLTMVAEIKDALDTGNSKTARRLAHTVKSMAGSLGALELYGVAADLESAIDRNRNESFETGKLLNDFDATLRAVMESIAVICKQENDSESQKDKKPPLDLAILFPMLEELGALLKGKNFAVSDCFEPIKTHITHTLIEKEFDLLEQHITDFDFDAALQELENIQKRLQQNEE